MPSCLFIKAFRIWLSPDNNPRCVLLCRLPDTCIGSRPTRIWAGVMCRTPLLPVEYILTATRYRDAIRNSYCQWWCSTISRSYRWWNLEVIWIGRLIRHWDRLKWAMWRRAKSGCCSRRKSPALDNVIDRLPEKADSRLCESWFKKQ